MELHPKNKIALEKIDFLNRYKNLRNKHSYSEQSFENYSNEEVENIIKDLGYSTKYNKRENFFEIKEILSNYEFQFNICLKYGLVELIWGIKKENKKLTIGGPWGVIADLIIGRDCEIKKPAFRNYQDLKEILKEAFDVYKDFKKELLKNENS